MDYNQPPIPKQEKRTLGIEDEYLVRSPLMYTATVVSGKWKSSIVWHISHAPGEHMRYNELKRDLPYRISHQALSKQLADLIKEEIIERHDYHEKQQHVDYTLTPKGKSLAVIIAAMRDWGAIWGPYRETSVIPFKGEPADDFTTRYECPLGALESEKRSEGEYLVWHHPDFKSETTHLDVLS